MYVRGGVRGGMRGYRGRGMGQTPLNCPGDPGCPGYPGSADQNPMIAAPLTSAQIAALSAANAAYFNQPTAAPTTFTSWLNTNALAIIFDTVLVIIALKALK